MSMKLTTVEKQLDSTLRSINKHLSDVFKTFGGGSHEYEKAQAVVKSQLHGNVIRMPEYDKGKMIKPLQLKRGRNALHAFSSQVKEVKQVRQYEKDVEKSAKVQAQKYIERLKKDNVKPTVQNIKKLATSIHSTSFNDIYTSVMNDSKIPDFEKLMFRKMSSNIHVDGLEQAEQFGIELLTKYSDIYYDSLGDDETYADGAEDFDINQLL